MRSFAMLSGLIRCFALALVLMLQPVVFTTYGDEAGKKKSLIEEWDSTLKYGISEQVLEVTKAIRDARETSLNEELAVVLSRTLDPDVRKAIVDYFIETGFKGAEGYAVSRIGAYEDEEKSFIVQLWKYLGAIRSGQVSELSGKFMDLSDDGLAIAAIQAIGKVKDTGKGKLLLEKLLDTEYPATRRSQLVASLGEIPYMEAVPALIKIVEDKGEDLGLRMNACEALGKMKDKSAVDALKKLFTENNALLKVYAAAALSSFDVSEVIDLLIEGLKDSNWKVRAESAKALAKKEAAAALDILVWKVKNDDARDVRIESMRALAVIGTGKSFDLLRSIALSETENIEIRGIAFGLCVTGDLGGSMDAVRKIVANESDKPPAKQKFLETAASELALVKSSALIDIFSKFLDSKNMVVRAYGIRGAVTNSAGVLRAKISKLAQDDPVPSVRREAEVALGKL